MLGILVRKKLVAYKVCAMVGDSGILDVGRMRKEHGIARVGLGYLYFRDCLNVAYEGIGPTLNLPFLEMWTMVILGFHNAKSCVGTRVRPGSQSASTLRVRSSSCLTLCANVVSALSGTSGHSIQLLTRWLH